MRFLWENHREIIRDAMDVDMSFRSRRLPAMLFKTMPLLTGLIYTIPASDLFEVPAAEGGLEGLRLRFLIAISGMIWGPAIAMLLAFYLKIAGRWLGGRGGWNQLRIVIAWAWVPHLLTWLLGFGIMYGRMNAPTHFSEAIFTFLWYIFYLVPVFSIALTILYFLVGISEVHGLGLGRSFAVAMIANVFLVLTGGILFGIFTFFVAYRFL